MNSIGRKRCLKFRIGSSGNPAYEALLDDPLIKVQRQEHFNSYEEVFVVVWFEDMNLVPFDPGKFGRRKEKSTEEEGGDDTKVLGEQRSPDQT